LVAHQDLITQVWERFSNSSHILRLSPVTCTSVRLERNKPRNVRVSKQWWRIQSLSDDTA